MERFRQAPVIIEAVRFAEENRNEIMQVLNSWYVEVDPMTGKMVRGWIDRIEGKVRVDLGDWIVKDGAGELYPCKPDVFQKAYERCLHNCH